MPRIWSRVESLAVAPWKARQVAQATYALSRQAATYVDLELADIISCGATLIQRVIALASAKYHPELLRQRESRGQAGWHVHLHHHHPHSVGRRR